MLVGNPILYLWSLRNQTNHLYSSNDRPTSLLPLFCHALKALSISKLIKNFISMCLLTVKQHGFRFSNTTANVLTIIVESVYEALDSNFEAPALALDILKTFDQVWYFS